MPGGKALAIRAATNPTLKTQRGVTAGIQATPSPTKGSQTTFLPEVGQWESGARSTPDIYKENVERMREETSAQDLLTVLTLSEDDKSSTTKEILAVYVRILLGERPEILAFFK